MTNNSPHIYYMELPRYYMDHHGTYTNAEFDNAFGILFSLLEDLMHGDILQIQLFSLHYEKRASAQIILKCIPINNPPKIPKFRRLF